MLNNEIESQEYFLPKYEILHVLARRLIFLFEDDIIFVLRILTKEQIFENDYILVVFVNITSSNWTHGPRPFEFVKSIYFLNN